MSGIFGGSKQSSSSTSSNRAFDTLNAGLGGVVGNAATGTNALQALLTGDTSGFNAFKNATGYNAAAEAGSRGITGNAAAGGLLRSGGTGKALASFGANLNQQFAGNYMDRLLGLANTGLQAGGVLAGAGQTSQSTQKSSSKPGIGGFLGQVASGVARSDRRLKTGISRVGKLANGVGVYMFQYKNDKSKMHVGVMADEVQKLAPEALGPEVDGYMTVNYDKLEGWTNGV